MNQKALLGLAILGIILVSGCAQQLPAPSPMERQEFKNLHVILSSGGQVGGSKLTIINNSAIFYGFGLGTFELKKGNLTDAKIEDAINVIEKNGFFSLDEGYEKYYATDLSHTTLTIDLNGKTKTVREYGTQGPSTLHNIQAFLTDVAKSLPQSNDVRDCETLETSVKSSCYYYFAAKNCNFTQNDKATYAEDFLVKQVGREYYDEHYKLNRVEGDYVRYNLTFPGIDTITDSFLEVKSRSQNDGCSLTISNSYILSEPVKINMTREDAIRQCALARNESELRYDSMDYLLGEDFIGNYGITIRFRNTTQPLMILCEVNLNTGTVLTTKEIYKTSV